MLSPPPHNTPSVVCVILNWNGWRDTINCLSALSRTLYSKLSVTVVDNCSADDSVMRIREAYPDVTLIQNASNLGFGGGVNVGLRHVLPQQPDYVWLLNNDTEPSPSALGELVRKAGSDDRLGAIGSVLFYAHDPNRVQAWGGGKVNCWVGYGSHSTVPREDSWFNYLTAASVLLPRRALEDVGLFDERFFLYWEDTDLCFRLRRQGWKLGVAGEAMVLHKENASSGGNRRAVDRYSTASGIQFLRKHSPLPWISVGAFVAMRIVRRLAAGRFAHIADVTGGIRDYRASRPVQPAVRSGGEGSELIVYGAFKGMGDFVSAAPVVLSQLNSGAKVVLLIFPQLRGFLDLLDFGQRRDNLSIWELPVSGTIRDLRGFLAKMSSISPEIVWISPHAPGPASSWKIPLLLWFVRRRYWPRARLMGARSERLSWLFDVPVDVDRSLPFKAREWTGYFLGRGNKSPGPPLAISFKASIQQSRLESAAYDLLIHPGAGAENRRWSARHFGALLAHIPVGYRIAVTGLPGDIARMKAVLPVDRVINYVIGTLEEAITAIGRSRVALVMDSGNMFFAGLLNVPTVALFGASDPSNVIAAGEDVVTMYERKCPYQPCGRPRCRQASVLCMDAIDPAKVAEQLLRLLQRTA